MIIYWSCPEGPFLGACPTIQRLACSLRSAASERKKAEEEVNRHARPAAVLRLRESQDAILHAFIAAHVAAAATVKTDGWPAYPGAADVDHQPHVIGPMAAHTVVPWIHRVFANLKRWALGVDHGLRRKHLGSYLDEFVFRFNRRRQRPAAFHSLLGISVQTPPVTYQMLIQPAPAG